MDGAIMRARRFPRMPPRRSAGPPRMGGEILKDSA